MESPAVAVIPAFSPIEDAVVRGGGRVVTPEEADALVWVAPPDPESITAVLGTTPARWVQLPLTGIEPLVEAGVIDPARTWTCTKGAYSHATAEHALALMLAASRKIHRHVVEKHWWPREEHARVLRLQGSTVVLVGTGGIGRKLGAMLAPLGVRLLAVNRSGAPLESAERTVKSGELPAIVEEADWLVLAAPQTAETSKIVDAQLVRRMKPSAWIVNVARGGLVDTEALLQALREERIAGAALDVTDPEPLPDDHPLWSLDNVIITSHTANTVEMAIPELIMLVEENVRRFARGEPLDGLVDPALGY